MLFFVSTSATTTTLQTMSICFVSSNSITTCTGRKRRAINMDGGCPSKMHLLLNLNLHRENKMLLRLLLMAQGTGGSCSTGSPPPPSPPQPPSPPPTPSAVPSALLPEPTFVDKPKTTKPVSLV